MKDPLRKTRTLANFCAHYHSGQWSRGYRLACRLIKRIARHGKAGLCGSGCYYGGPIDLEMYRELEKKWANKI
jgi:hypothetical protein